MKNIIVYLTMAFALFGLSNAVNAQYKKLYDFNDTNGNSPYGSLTLSGSVLYGMAVSGGVHHKGVIFSYDLKDITGVNEVGGKKPEVGIKVYPNPVNSLLVVSYSLLEKGNVNIGVYDVMGNRVDELGIGDEESGMKGEHRINYDASGLRSGVYFVRMESEEGIGESRFVKL